MVVWNIARIRVIVIFSLLLEVLLPVCVLEYIGDLLARRASKLNYDISELLSAFRRNSTRP